MVTPPHPPPERNSRTDDAIAWPAPLLDALVAIVRDARVTILLAVLGVGLGAALAVRAPDWYQAGAVALLLPRERPTVDFSIRSRSLEASEATAERADAAPLLLPPQPELYTEILTSDEVLGAIALRFEADLSRAVSPDVSTHIAELRARVAIVGTEQGMLTVQARAPSGRLAAEIANALLAEGEAASRRLERSLLEQQIGHLEIAIRDVRNTLVAEEQALAAFLRDEGLVDPEHESSETLRQVRETNMKRDELQRELEVLLLSYTEADPGVRALTAQIARAERRVAELRASIAGSRRDTNFGDLLIRHGRLEQSVQFRGDLLQTLRTQLDVFRVRAEQPAGSLVTLKQAVAPNTPGGPRRKRIFGATIAGALVIAVLVALLREQWRRSKQDPYCAARIADLKLLTRRSPRHERKRAS